MFIYYLKKNEHEENNSHTKPIQVRSRVGVIAKPQTVSNDGVKYMQQPPPRDKVNIYDRGLRETDN